MVLLHALMKHNIEVFSTCKMNFLMKCLKNKLSIKSMKFIISVISLYVSASIYQQCQTKGVCVCVCVCVSVLCISCFYWRVRGRVHERLTSHQEEKQNRMCSTNLGKKKPILCRVW